MPSVRLLTTKATPTQAAKSRGIAFLELPSSTVLQACLKLHHSELKGRTINVELTAGGGGSSEDRKKKIQERNQRVGGQRERRAEREKETGGGEENDAFEGQPSGQKGDDEKKAKMRGGRRVKAKVSRPPYIDPGAGTDPILHRPLTLWLLFHQLRVIKAQILLPPQDPLQKSIPVANFRKKGGNPPEPIPYRLGKSSSIYILNVIILIFFFHAYLSVCFTQSMHNPAQTIMSKFCTCMYNSCCASLL